VPSLDGDATLEAQQRVTARPEILGTKHADERNALLLIGGLQNQARSEVPDERADLHQFVIGHRPPLARRAVSLQRRMDNPRAFLV